MKEEFFKFPTTPHLATQSGIDIRRDKILTESERDEFLQHEIIVEEKVDGANLGISFDSEGHLRAQNRGSYLLLPGSGQWKKLDEWIKLHFDLFLEFLSERYILFGEWCYAQHSIFYDRLPDWFLGFDVYDKQSQNFLASAHRDRLLANMNISKVPFLAHGHFVYPEILKFLCKSELADQPAEGLYLRIESDEWLLKRAKLVRPAFVQSMQQHWSRSTLKPNRLLNKVDDEPISINRPSSTRK
jgi:hypothetical protein